jgi:hypothetical protein
MTNPLIAKYEELYGKKEEPKPDYYKGEKSYAEELEELEELSVATSNTGITAVNPSRTFTSYDPYSGGDSFLQIAEKIQKGEARVVGVSVNMEHFTKSYTFEVQVYT